MISDPRSPSRTPARLARTLLATLFALSVCGAAFAQYENAPFDTDALGISAGTGAEMAVVRLRAAAAILDANGSEDAVEEVLEGMRFEVMRFGAALAQQDPAATDAVDAALEQLDDATDDELAEVVDAVLPTFVAARDAVTPADAASDPPYTAAVMTLLLTSQTGVAEGYEEAVEGEEGPYAIGWAALARTQELWADLKPLASEDQAFEIDDMFDDLNALFTGPEIPAAAASADPEEAEGSAMRITGFLESLASASLFPNRDLGALLKHTHALASAGCDAYTAGQRRVADAHLAWTAFAFEEYLGGTLGLFAPEPTETAGGLLDQLVPLEGEEEGEEAEDVAGADGVDADEEAEWEPLSDAEAATTCQALVAALQEAGGPLGL